MSRASDRFDLAQRMWFDEPMVLRARNLAATEVGSYTGVVTSVCADPRLVAKLLVPKGYALLSGVVSMDTQYTTYEAAYRLVGLKLQQVDCAPVTVPLCNWVPWVRIKSKEHYALEMLFRK